MMKRGYTVMVYPLLFLSKVSKMSTLSKIKMTSLYFNRGCFDCPLIKSKYIRYSIPSWTSWTPWTEKHHRIPGGAYVLSY